MPRREAGVGAGMMPVGAMCGRAGRASCRQAWNLSAARREVPASVIICTCARTIGYWAAVVEPDAEEPPVPGEEDPCVPEALPEVAESPDVLDPEGADPLPEVDESPVPEAEPLLELLLPEVPAELPEPEEVAPDEVPDVVDEPEPDPVPELSLEDEPVAEPVPEPVPWAPDPEPLPEDPFPALLFSDVSPPLDSPPFSDDFAEAGPELEDPCAAVSVTWTFSLVSWVVPPMPAPRVTKLTMMANASTATRDAAAATRVARLRCRLRSTPRAAVRISGGAMGVPDSAISSISARPLTERVPRRWVTCASAPTGPTCLSFSAEAERIELYTCEAAAEAKPPMRVPMIEPARPIFAESAKEVAAASPDAITVANEKSEKMPFFSSGTWFISCG